ncbi:MAG TPA: inner membrane-spanning protein YciB [Pseudomonadales bacterium]|nr:inner membrane-spanning protein YciB [Pseudomonadales bacterium]
MLQLLELLPLAIFVLVFRLKGHSIDIAGLHHDFDGIYSATAALMISTVLQVMIVWLWKRTIEKRLLWLLATVLVMGSATLLLHNPLFLQWKPTIFNWAMAIVLLVGHFVARKNIVHKLVGEQLQLPENICARISFVWAAYFIVVGALNLFVAYHFSEAFWVDYKLWSSIGFTVLISVVTAIIIAPHMQENSDTTSPSGDN